MRVMPAAPSREPSAQRAWSIRPGRPSWTTRAGVRELAARAWSGHRLFIIVLTPAVLLRVDAELGYRWHAWFNDSFQYVQNTVHFQLDPTRVSGYSIWLKILQPLHTYAVVTILQHLMGLAVAVMIYALARHRFGAPAWLATLATVPLLYDGFEIQLEHLIMADIPFLFLLTLAVTLMLWVPVPSLLRCALIGGLLGLAAIAVLPGNPPGIARKHAVGMIGELTLALNTAADALEARDAELAAQALRRIRTQEPIDDFRDALRTAREIQIISPLHRGRRRHVLRSYLDAAEPLDHALRNCRVLLRRTRSALVDDEPVPTDLVAGLRDLAHATELLAEHLGGTTSGVREALRDAAAAVDSDSLAHGGFSGQVVAAQLRSVAVDLLQATGLRHDEARALLPTIGQQDG